MKELLLQYANYNVWANNLIIATMLKLDEAQTDVEVVSSFPSLRKTVYHTWGAEYVWSQRLAGVGQPAWLPNEFHGTFAEACLHWQVASQALLDYVNTTLSDEELTKLIDYHDMRKNAHASRACDMLNHVFNHSTYHRGQLVTMLRQLGVTELPSTDMIAFVRGK